MWVYGFVVDYKVDYNDYERYDGMMGRTTRLGSFTGKLHLSHSRLNTSQPD